VVGKRHLQHDTRAREALRAGTSQLLGGVAVVVMTQDASGRATYNGRPDLAKFLARVPVSAIPWRRYQLAA
jgi:hypothetical protein